MSEKRFLSCVLVEGLLLTIMGISMLLLPKITSITFGIMICFAFIVYGGYKAINAFMSRNYTRHYVLNMLLGVLLAIIGAFLLFAPTFNLLWITALIGVYFLTESIASIAFAFQTKNVLSFWWTFIPVAFLEFFIGLIIILGLPTTALWVVGILAGVNFLFAGMMLVSMYIATKYSRNV